MLPQQHRKEYLTRKLCALTTIVNAANRPFLELVPGPMVARYSAVASLGLLLATLLLIVVTRGRLGYQPDQPLQPANTSQGVDLPVAQA